VKEENGDILAYFYSNLNRWNNYFPQLLTVHNVSDVRQIEVHTAEPLVPRPSHLEVEIAIANWKKYKSPGSDQILAELIQAGGEILLPAIHKLINYIWNKKDCQIRGGSLIMVVPIHEKGEKKLYLGYHCYQLHEKF
jgi:hypothetical protein